MNRFSVGDIIVRMRGGDRYLRKGDVCEVIHVSESGQSLRLRPLGEHHPDALRAWYDASFFVLRVNADEPM
jgi:hypothetical protein